MKNLRLIAEVAQTLVGLKEFDARMEYVLRRIGEWTSVSRAYIFLDDSAGETTSNTHEWCAPGIEAVRDRLQQVPYSLIPSWRVMLLRDGRILSEDIRQLPEDLVVALEPQGIKSLVVYPLSIDNQTRGFVGFDDCVSHRRWSPVELVLLQTLSGLISNAYEAKLDRDRVQASEDNFRTFFDTIDDLMVIGDREGRILYVNAAVTRKLGYSATELVGTAVIDMHPEDAREEARQILGAMFSGERDNCPLELRRKDGGRIPVETRIWFGRWNGAECLFGISKDLSKEQEALQKFTRLFENNPALMAISSVDEGRFLDVNRAFVERLGYSKAEVIGRTSAELKLFAQPEARARVARELQKSESTSGHELEVQRKDGRTLHGIWSAELIKSQGKQLLLTVMVDVSESMELHRRLASEHKRLTNVVEGTRLGSWEWNVQTGQTVFNERWAEMVGYTLAELTPVSIETWTNLAHPDDLAKSGELLNKHFSGELDYYELEGRMRHKDGHWVWVLDRGKVIEWDAQGRPLWMFGTHTDITEKKLLEERIREVSIRDGLTNVFNRRHIFERLEEVVAETLRGKRQFSLCLFDLDHFKDINDHYGHLAGDAVLKEIAETTSMMIRPYDLVGRYGGEEFVVVMLNANESQATVAMDRILATVRERRIVHRDKRLSVTFSCGAVDSSEFAADKSLLDAMLEEADARLYKAKANGRNQVIGRTATSMRALTSQRPRNDESSNVIVVSYHP